ncbi:MAG: AbrB/MazE/SpoVT family DNA-binding domain-containing protein [Usitatibacter sp.]
MLVCRWGNSLAVRLPAGSAIAMGVAEGDKLIAEISADGRLILSPERKVAGRTATRSLRRFLAGQEDTAPVVERIRRSARY